MTYLRTAVYCLDCEAVFDIREKACPACASSTFEPVERKRPPEPAPVEQEPIDSPARFFYRYKPLLPARLVAQFTMDLIDVLKGERDRQRRRLTTDSTAFEIAALHTEYEIKMQGGTVDQSSC